MTTPREHALKIERTPMPTGDGERFARNGFMGQPFGSGHVLPLRQFVHSSISVAVRFTEHPAG